MMMAMTDPRAFLVRLYEAAVQRALPLANKIGAVNAVVATDVTVSGNTSAASIPLALDYGVRSGQVQPGQNVLLEGVGGGFTWGAVLVKM